ncbi:predicted protein [Pyrenophora tritici-repentis Pt-1C-BFP]|uniref:Uncharacterized protein n=1 Tax=Pyrenophora tritici-repentis (strain Pt-1C-BFP) TaxID=426418 RepID=B2W627_PYRTR|nr:uncharacterized protein PTRG_06185 [Pyrenophora tritici-repentis Pt-1C-BFP]EDU49105.1 predicted protein [Pyrenophora tritici-repentis Pt-1C-BFP]
MGICNDRSGEIPPGRDRGNLIAVEIAVDVIVWGCHFGVESRDKPLVYDLQLLCKCSYSPSDQVADPVPFLRPPPFKHRSTAVRTLRKVVSDACASDFAESSYSRYSSCTLESMSPGPVSKTKLSPPCYLQTSKQPYDFYGLECMSAGPG